MFTRKPPRFSCLLPDPRELIEIKNKKKVHIDIPRAQPLPALTGCSLWGSVSENKREFQLTEQFPTANFCACWDFSSPPVSFEALSLLLSHVIRTTYCVLLGKCCPHWEPSVTCGDRSPGNWYPVGHWRLLVIWSSGVIIGNKRVLTFILVLLVKFK